MKKELMAGVIGFFLFVVLTGSIASVVHTINEYNVIQRLKYQSCVGELASQPHVLREQIQNHIRDMFVWYADPSMQNRVEAKNSSLRARTNMAAFKGLLQRHDCEKEFPKYLEERTIQAIEATKSGNLKSFSIDDYAKDLEWFVAFEDSMSDRCCKK